MEEEKQTMHSSTVGFTSISCCIGSRNCIRNCFCSCWLSPALRVGQLGKVLRPDPAHQLRRVVLVLGQPQLALFGNDVEDLL